MMDLQNLMRMLQMYQQSQQGSQGTYTQSRSAPQFQNQNWWDGGMRNDWQGHRLMPMPWNPGSAAPTQRKYTSEMDNRMGRSNTIGSRPFQPRPVRQGYRPQPQPAYTGGVVGTDRYSPGSRVTGNGVYNPPNSPAMTQDDYLNQTQATNNQKVQQKRYPGLQFNSNGQYRMP